MKINETLENKIHKIHFNITNDAPAGTTSILYCQCNLKQAYGKLGYISIF